MEKVVRVAILALVLSPLAAVALYWQPQPAVAQIRDVPMRAFATENGATVLWKATGDLACVMRDTTVIGCGTGELVQAANVDINLRLQPGDVLILYAYRIGGEETTLVGVGSAMVKARSTTFLPLIFQPENCLCLRPQ